MIYEFFDDYKNKYQKTVVKYFYDCKENPWFN